jgi:amidase
MVLRMPWNQAMYELEEHGGGERLCFGLQWHNNHVKPNPPYIRAIKKVRDSLVAQGHSVIDFQFPDTAGDLELLVSRPFRGAS